MTDKNTVEIAAQCLARHDGHIVIFMALKPLGRHSNEIARSRRIKTIMKLLRGRTSISLIDLDLVTLIRERDGAGNYILTDVLEVEGTRLAWLSDPMNQYLRLYEAVAKQQQKTSRCTIRAVHAKGATVLLLGLINFDESAMLDLRSLADEVWQVQQADMGPRRTSNTILVTAGLPATRMAPAYLALGHTQMST